MNMLLYFLVFVRCADVRCFDSYVERIMCSVILSVRLGIYSSGWFYLLEALIGRAAKRRCM